MFAFKRAPNAEKVVTLLCYRNETSFVRKHETSFLNGCFVRTCSPARHCRCCSRHRRAAARVQASLESSASTRSLLAARSRAATSGLPLVGKLRRRHLAAVTPLGKVREQCAAVQPRRLERARSRASAARPVCAPLQCRRRRI